jgi:hypothetical protein
MPSSPATILASMAASLPAYKAVFLSDHSTGVISSPLATIADESAVPGGEISVMVANERVS